jgi:hypothetical protein
MIGRFRNMNRTAVFRTSLKLAVGALAAAAVLTACGGPLKMGAAATIGDRRITIAQLDSTVARWQEEFARNPRAGMLQQQAQQQNQRIPFDPDSPKRSALYQLIDFRIWTEVARRQGIAVTQGQIDGFLASLGGRANVAPSVLANAVPLSHTDDLVRSALTQQVLLQRFGVRPDPQGQIDPNTQQRALQQLEAAYIGATRQMKIVINPRYGTFDPQRVTLNPVAYGLSKTEPGTG